MFGIALVARCRQASGLIAVNKLPCRLLNLINAPIILTFIRCIPLGGWNCHAHRQRVLLQYYVMRIGRRPTGVNNLSTQSENSGFVRIIHATRFIIALCDTNFSRCIEDQAVRVSIRTSYCAQLHLNITLKCTELTHFMCSLPENCSVH
jgi:hypothetical protein